jgi:hypothetical protein
MIRCTEDDRSNQTGVNLTAVTRPDTNFFCIKLKGIFKNFL